MMVRHRSDSADTDNSLLGDPGARSDIVENTRKEPVSRHGDILPGIRAASVTEGFFGYHDAVEWLDY